MDKLRLLYTAKIFVTPSVWIRTEKKHAAFDRWLWEALVSQTLTIDDEYTAGVAGVNVWIANAPYANGKQYRNDRFSCGRATALLLKDKVDALLRDKAKAEWTAFEKAHGLARVNR
jgi:hypothetical protein